LIYWAWTTTAGLLGIAAAALWPGGHVLVASWVAALIIVPIGPTTVAVWRRQRREDASTVEEWVSSRRRPPA
jgi:low temperature requirement protein LtrA